MAHTTLPDQQKPVDDYQENKLSSSLNDLLDMSISSFESNSLMEELDKCAKTMEQANKDNMYINESFVSGEEELDEKEIRMNSKKDNSKIEESKVEQKNTGGDSFLNELMQNANKFNEKKNLNQVKPGDNGPLKIKKRNSIASPKDPIKAAMLSRRKFFGIFSFYL